MADNDLQISAEIYGGKSINDLEAELRKLRAEFKANKIGSDEFNSSALKLKNTLELKSKATAVAATENAKLMKSYFETGEALRRTNPAFVSFNQVIQDAPYGVRGVANNVQFLTQQFTQLRSAGLTTGQILKGMMQNMLTPMGALMFAVSAGTSLLTIAMDKLGQETKETKDEFEGLRGIVDDINRMQFERGAISIEEYRKRLADNVKFAKQAIEDLRKEAEPKIETIVTSYKLKGTKLVPSQTTQKITPGREISVAETREKQKEYEVALKAQRDFDEDVKKLGEKGAKEKLKQLQSDQEFSYNLQLEFDEKSTSYKIG